MRPPGSPSDAIAAPRRMWMRLLIAYHLLAQSTFAQFVWIGGNGLWSDVEEWRDGLAPTLGGSPTADFVFAPREGGSLVSQNDLASPYLLNELTLQNSSALQFSISGGAIRTGGNNAGIHLKGDQNATIVSAIELAQETSHLLIDGDGFGNVVISGEVRDGEGARGVHIAMEPLTTVGQLLTLSGSNTYTGGTRIDSGNIVVGGATPLGTGSVTIGGGTFGFDTTTTGFGPTVANPISLEAGLVVVGTGSGRLLGVISGAEPQLGVNLKHDSGNVSIEAAATYTGPTIIEPVSLFPGPFSQPSLTLAGAGSILHTSRVVVASNAALKIVYESTGTGNVFPDAAPIELRSGLLNVTNYSGKGVFEEIGPVTASGYSSFEIEGASPITLLGDSFLRVDRGTFRLQGSKLGRASSETSFAQIRFQTPPSGLVGGTGSLTELPIIPYGISTYAGLTLVTYNTERGFLPLDTAVDYAPTLAGENPSRNVRLTQNETNDEVVSLNALVLAGTDITGHGTLRIQSGTVALDGFFQVIENSVDFGNAEGNIFVHGSEDSFAGEIRGTSGITISGTRGDNVTFGAANPFTGPLTINGAIDLNAADLLCISLASPEPNSAATGLRIMPKTPDSRCGVPVVDQSELPMRCVIEPGLSCVSHAAVRSGWRRFLATGTLAAIAMALWAAAAIGADLDETRALVRKGAYVEAIAAAREGAKTSSDEPDWALVEAEALASVGQYREAQQALTAAIGRFPSNLRLHLAAYDAERTVGKIRAAKAHLDEIERLGTTRPWQYRGAADQLALGRAALLLDADPQRVLQLFFDPVQKQHPEMRESYLASGDLALAKSDYALAAKTFSAGTKKFADDADMWFGLGRAHASSDGTEALRALEKTLQLNPNHTGAQLELADHFVDAEEYEKAQAALAAALKTNPNLADAHAYRAVLAHLQNDEHAERQERAAALKFWPKNPNVPHLIGRKLSQKYRFAEGAALQREALKFDPTFLAAKAQLASDLLRLGDDKEGWQLAEEVQTADPYDVVAYNLTALREVLGKFRTLQSPHFTLRMDPHEAAIYGDQALALLERAHQTITKKYGLELKERTIVEVFPDQKDFAIRTFGLPGGSGYLGVCFGRVITANSPASRANSPSNWEAVLWHEFTHVVTLTLTKNKMPRWLSEGISVFEERQARGSWGEQMKPRYRAMILGDDLTPVSELSAAFLKPKSAVHLGFAYYESSLVVEWLIERWGLPKMKQLLADLAQGAEINAALARAFASIEKLDAEFAAHARELAANTAPKLDWSKPTPAQVASDKALTEFLAQHPNNFVALTQLAQELVKGRQWEAAKAPLKKLIDLYPNQHDEDGAYSMLALVHRELNESDAEFALLTKFADLASDATDAFLRLMQICAERKQWDKVLDYAARFEAVDPLRPEPHRFKAQASEALARNNEAISGYRALLQLQPADPAEVHFRLGRLLHQRGDPEAKRHVLLALEEAPRFRDAHELLMQIAEPRGATPPPTTSSSKSIPSTTAPKPPVR